jgi:transcriptional regulator with XRE-family HTH domain
MTQVGRLIYSARKSVGLSGLDLVRLAGYENCNKGQRRLQAIESGHDLLPHPAVLYRFSKALGIDECDVLLAQSLDFYELDKPIHPYLLARMPGWISRDCLPPDCPVERACGIALRYAVQADLTVYLMLSRIRAIRFLPSGQCSQVYGQPGARRRRKKPLRLFRQGEGVPLEWSKISVP